MSLRKRRDTDPAFADFVHANRGRMVTTARLLTAGDADLAEDLVQTALVKVYVSWHRVSGEPAAYARRVLVNCFVDHRRKPAVRREQATDDVPDTVAPAGPAALDPTLVAALAELPPRMRAAVVLRHVHDLSVEETAGLLGCSTGTVKSQTARGLDKLRAHLEPQHAHPVPTPGDPS
ncbi:SigE family RNA polymerase sigma factor [Nocardioides panacisoli]|uniref:SigE family RNA polymerase sigma factor n=1 Tax=Nocardioides panacisoli TaxID=627624 RepID=A0ABP7IAN5_9ACTN